MFVYFIVVWELVPYGVVVKFHWDQIFIDFIRFLINDNLQIFIYMMFKV